MTPNYWYWLKEAFDHNKESSHKYVVPVGKENIEACETLRDAGFLIRVYPTSFSITKLGKMAVRLMLQKIVLTAMLS